MRVYLRSLLISFWVNNVFHNKNFNVIVMRLCSDPAGDDTQYSVYALCYLPKMQKFWILKHTWPQGFQMRDSGPSVPFCNLKRVENNPLYCFATDSPSLLGTLTLPPSPDGDPAQTSPAALEDVGDKQGTSNIERWLAITKLYRVAIRNEAVDKQHKLPHIHLLHVPCIHLQHPRCPSAPTCHQKMAL